MSRVESTGECERAIVEGLPHPLRAGRDDLVEHARVQRPGGHRVDVDVVLAQFLGKCLSEAHNGRLWAASGDGRGATFCFTLPLTSSAPS